MATAPISDRLIAACPTMYEALERIANETCNHGAGEFCPRELAQEAISKARGVYE